MINDEGFDTYSTEWLWICLARELLAKETMEYRREFIATWKKRHGNYSAEKLKSYLMQEYKRIRGNDRSANE